MSPLVTQINQGRSSGGSTSRVASAGETLPLVVTYEDRKSALPGVELLARSLARHAPSLRLMVFSPLTEVGELAARLPNMQAAFTEELIGHGWNVKPTVLLWALDLAPEVLWLDTDIIVSGDLTALMQAVPDDAFVVGQEFSGIREKGGQVRAEKWGFEVGRLIPYHVNSGSIRALLTHRALLEDWRDLLNDPAYVATQRNRVPRPIHMVGDQDVLWALLVSKKYTHIPVHYIKSGSEMVIHCGANGYHVIDRLGHLFGSRAAFVHMLGSYKPWSFGDMPDRKTSPEDYLNMVCFELSPYHAASAPFAADLGNPAWLKRRTPLARTLNALTGGHVALRGLPLAAIAWIHDARVARTDRLRRKRRLKSIK